MYGIFHQINSIKLLPHLENAFAFRKRAGNHEIVKFSGSYKVTKMPSDAWCSEDVPQANLKMTMYLRTQNKWVDFPASHRQFVKGFYTQVGSAWHRTCNSLWWSECTTALLRYWLLHDVFATWTWSYGVGDFFLLDLWFAFSVFFWGDNFCQQVNSGTSIERIGCVNGFWCKTSCWPAIGLKRKETFSWSIGRIPWTYPWKSTTIKKMGDSFWKMINPYKK